MQAIQFDAAKLPSSIRRDSSGKAVTLRQAPRSPLLPKTKRMDAKLLQHRVQMLHRDGHMDANETAMFLRSLLYIMPQAYEFKYAAIKYADLFPVNYSVPSGARSHAFHEFDELGQAQLMDNFGDNAPNAERVGFETIGQIFSVRSEYSYTIQDIRSATYSGTPLDAMKAVTARRIIERKCDALAAVGDTAHSFTGIANDTNITSVTATTKAAGGLKWGNLSGSTVTPNATANEILNDCNVMLDGVFVPTKGQHTPNTLIFGTQNWAIINTMRLDSFNMVTVATYLMNALPWIDALEYWPQLDTANSGAERILCMERSRENFEIIIPQEFEQFPPQWVNLAAKVPCHKRWGGVQMRFPKSISKMDGTV